MARSIAFIILPLSFGLSQIQAQNVGKLAGTVVDSVTGQPLPGATVLLNGTGFGAAANAEGEYFIIGVPVGTYTVQASFVGYTALTVTDVEINQDYTKELNFRLSEEIEALDELVVEYERPLIQKDAIGVPKVITGKELETLSIRGVIPIAAIQGGVVAGEGSDDLHARGGRDEEIVYFIDGVKIIGTVGIPQQAIQEQNLLIGSLPAKYGDAMSGVISITTKRGGANLFGSIEGISSFGLDEYGYGLTSLSVGGPILADKLSFYVAGEYLHMKDLQPSAIEVPRLRQDRIDFLKENPQSLRFLDPDGHKVYLPMPGHLDPTVDSDGDGDADAVSFAEMLEQINVPDGYVLDSPVPISGAEVEPFSNFEFDGSRPNFGLDRFTATGNLTFAASSAIRLRIGGRYDGLDQSHATSMSRMVFNYDRLLAHKQQTYGLGASWTHRLSNSTFYQLRTDWSRYDVSRHDPAFSSDVADALFYGDIDHPANTVAARQRIWDPGDSLYVASYEDGGSLPGEDGIYDVLTDVGVGHGFYQRDENDQFRISGEVTTQIGLHQIEFGGEFEQRTQRHFRISGLAVAGYFDDGSVEAGIERAVTAYAELPFSVIGQYASHSYWGYDYLGISRTDHGDVDTFTAGTLRSCNERSDQPDPACNIPPYEPILYAGYAQDKIEYRDLVLNLGLRVDVFDNNTLVLRDPFALVPIVRAERYPERPENIGPEFAVYFDGAGKVIGYRDLEGTFFNAAGEQTGIADIRNLGTTQILEGALISTEVFEDYEPQATWMPRVGVSFAVTDRALFFAHYDKTSQRPFEMPFASFNDYRRRTQGGGGGLGNSNLLPETTTEYELGFRQRLGSRSALMLSGFYKKIDNLIQFDFIRGDRGIGYWTVAGYDFGTVKGVQLEFDLRRTEGVALNANYTVQFASGTGSDALSSLRATLGSRPPDFLFPLNFDRRHSINLNLDYRLGKGEGPNVFGTTVFENFGLNIIGSFNSGLPYTRREWPARTVAGDLNGERMPWSSLVNARIDRRFNLTRGLNLTAFVWIQNLLDVDNEVSVYSTSGQPEDDGYLSTRQGRSDLRSHEVRVCGLDCDGEIVEVAEMLSSFSLNSPWHYGIPRMIRLGLRMNF